MRIFYDMLLRQRRCYAATRSARPPLRRAALWRAGRRTATARKRELSGWRGRRWDGRSPPTVPDWAESRNQRDARGLLPPRSVGAVARQTADVLSRLAEERGVELECTLADGDRLVVAGDQDELLRVAENLVENAVKYGRTGGRVDVRAERVQTASGDEVVLSVRDYGPGIAAGHLPRLTERFYRVDVAESRDKGGTGLGLAIVKHIVNRHRGRLAVESRPGEGATFRVAVPALD